jgi:flagellar hook-associated protein 1
LPGEIGQQAQAGATAMTISSVLQSGLSALLANQQALRVTSSNIANVNNPDYVRRTVQMETQLTGGSLGGVEIAGVNRAVDRFLADSRLSAISEAGTASPAAALLDQLQRYLGRPDQDFNPAARLSKMLASFGALATDPASHAAKASIVGDMQEFALGVTQLNEQIQALRAQADAEIVTAVSQINALTARIADLNIEVQRETLSGNPSTGLRDQRDSAIRELAGFVEIDVVEDQNGAVTVTTPSGLALVSPGRTVSVYAGAGGTGASVYYDDITTTRTNMATGQQIGPALTLEQHVSGGKLRGLLDLRNTTLPNFAQDLASLASATAETLNAAHNNASTYPAPQTLTGRNTGLVAGDAHNFSGRSSIAVVSAGGALVRRIDIDFGAGTLSVNGGAASAIGATVGSLTAAINTALGGDGSASFVNGALSIGATATGNGIALQQDTAQPSSRAGRGFAQVFGLNDLFTATAPSSFATGIPAGSAHGFSPGQTIAFAVRAPDGSIERSIQYTVSGATFADMIGGLNAAAAPSGSFALDASGRMSFTPAQSGRTLDTVNDQTARTGSNVSFSALFGIGRARAMEQAEGFAVRAEIVSNPSRLAGGMLDLRTASVPGDIVLTSGDNRGVLALQAAQGPRTFEAAGFMQAQTATLRDYGSLFLAGIGQRAGWAQASLEDAQAVEGEISQRASAKEGVNMDEELARMMTFQQAYNAGARLITTAQRMYDELFRALQ